MPGYAMLQEEIARQKAQIAEMAQQNTGVLDQINNLASEERRAGQRPADDRPAGGEEEGGERRSKRGGGRR